MKEASGEANLTVITIILIGVVVAIAVPLVNSLMSTSAVRACCTDAGGTWGNNQCTIDGAVVDRDALVEDGECVAQ